MKKENKTPVKGGVARGGLAYFKLYFFKIKIVIIILKKSEYSKAHIVYISKQLQLLQSSFRVATHLQIKITHIQTYPK